MCRLDKGELVMLDIWYPSLSALILACRDIRAYLRNPNNATRLNDNPEAYNIRRILPMYREEIVFINGVPQVTYRASGYFA